MSESTKLSKRERFKQLFQRSHSPQKAEAVSQKATSSTSLDLQAPAPSTLKTDTLSPAAPLATPSAADEKGALIAARNHLWEKAFKRMKEQSPELALLYEKLIKEDAELDQNADAFAPDTTTVIVQKQQTRMEQRQWTYSWFGKDRKVRDTAESILTTVNKVSGLVSVGMSSAPPFVSLPWSMAISLVGFVMSDFEAASNAINGLKEVTGILANYSYAEREFLLSTETKQDYENIVLPLYTSIFTFQALAAQYFAKSTLKRLGINTMTTQSWPSSLETVRLLDQRCSMPLDALGVHLGQKRFSNIEALLNQGVVLLDQISRSVTTEQGQRDKIMKWISPIKHLEEHMDKRNRIGDTYLHSGQWLLHNEDQFLPWKRSRNEALLLQGIVGSGKTSLTSMVIQNLLETEAVAFFYFSAESIQKSQHTTINIFRSLLAQCSLLPDGSVADRIQTAFNNSDQQSSGGCDMTLGAVISVLQELLQDRIPAQMTFVFDALDECQDPDNFLAHLVDLMKASPNVRVFISSRFGVAIDGFFDSYRSMSINIHNSGDIKDYVESEIAKRGAGLSEHQAKRLKQALTGHANGCFRWVVLELNIFLRRTQRQGLRMHPKDIDDRLASLESSEADSFDLLLNAYELLYQSALGEKSEQYRQSVVKAAIKWVLCSFTELHSLTLCQALNDADITIDDILAYCANFLVRSSDDTIKLAHLSVRQFFEERRSEEFSVPQQHLPVAITCVRSMQNFSKSPFSSYAKDFWFIHCRAAHKSADLEVLLQSITKESLGPSGRLLLYTANNKDVTVKDALGNTMLHQAVMNQDWLGYEILTRVNLLLCHSKLSSITNNSGNTPIHVAAMSGKTGALVKTTILDPQFDKKNIWQASPFQIAAVLRQLDIITYATRSGIAWTDTHQNDVLHYAAFFNDTKTTRLIWENDLVRLSVNDDVLNQLQLAVKAKAIMAATALLKPSRVLLKTIRIQQNIPFSRFPTHKMIRIVVEDDELRNCKFCDMERWINTPQTHVYFSSSEQLLRVIDLDRQGLLNCSLCSCLADRAHALVSSTISAKTDEVRVRFEFGFEVMLSGEGAGRDSLVISYADAQEEFEICMDPRGANSHLAGVYFRRRCIDTHPTSIQIADKLRTWISQCHQEHDICNTALKWSPETLIDVGTMEHEETPRIVDCGPDWAPQDKRFVFFSARFVPEMFHMTKANAQELRDGIELGRLAQTHQDAIWICRRLGYRYLWADTLCFAQDDESVRSRAITWYGRYCESADLVLAASNMMLSGLFSPRDPGRTVNFTARLSDEDVLNEQDHPSVKESLGRSNRETVESKTLERLRLTDKQPFHLQLRSALKSPTAAINDDLKLRGWRLQEALLPRRLVYLGQEQLIWSCCETCQSEGGSIPSQPEFDTITSLKTRLNAEIDKYKRSLEVASEMAFDYWRSVVEMASEGEITREEYRLMILDGMADSLQSWIRQRFHDSRYIAGLWTLDICTGLLWVSAEPYRKREFKDDYAPPSFSYAWSRTPVSYRLAPGMRIRPDIPGSLELVDTCLAPDPVLTVSAFVKEVSVDISDVQHYEYFWDAVNDPKHAKDPESAMTYAECLNSGLCHTTFAIVAPWTFCPSIADTNDSAEKCFSKPEDARWAGLVLERRPDGMDGYLRKGVFLGPFCTDDLSGWARKELKLY